MLIKLFSRFNSVVLFALVIYTLVTHFNLFLNPIVVEAVSYAPLSNLVFVGLERIAELGQIFLVLFYIGLVILQSLFFNYVIDKHKLFKQPSLLPALSLVILYSLFDTQIFLSPAFFSAFFIIKALDKVLECLFSSDYVPVFDAGFFIGIASLFYLPALFIAPVVFIGLSTSRTFDIREWVVGLSAVIIPYFLFGTYFFLNNEFLTIGIPHFQNPSGSFVQIEWAIGEVLVKAIALFAIMLIAVFLFQVNFLKIIMRTRKMLTLLVYLMAISLLSLIFISSSSLSPVSLCLIPLATFLTYVFLNLPALYLAETIHLFLLVLLLFFQYNSQISLNWPF